jgi:hypothetical protein
MSNNYQDQGSLNEPVAPVQTSPKGEKDEALDQQDKPASA